MTHIIWHVTVVSLIQFVHQKVYQRVNIESNWTGSIWNQTIIDWYQFKWSSSIRLSIIISWWYQGPWFHTVRFLPVCSGDVIVSPWNQDKFLVKDEITSAVVFEEKLEIDKSQFYLSETIMNSEIESIPFQPIQKLDLDDLIQKLS